MKFVHVSFFLAVANFKLGSGALVDDFDEESDAEGRRRRRRPAPVQKFTRTDEIAEAKAYLAKNFPGDKYEDARLDYMEYAHHANENKPDGNSAWANGKAWRQYPGENEPRPCFVQGHAVGGTYSDNDDTSSFENERWGTGVGPGEFIRCKGRDRKARDQSCAEQCCSGKLTTESLYNKHKAVCDCIAKGEPIIDDAGSQCCSMYAVKKGDGFVCGGIPPLRQNQHLILHRVSLIRLNVENCMYPAGNYLDGLTSTDRYLAHDGMVTTRICGRRPCQRSGAKPAGALDICCGLDKKWDRSADPSDVVCGCSLPDVKHDKHIDARASDCCSGTYKSPATNRVCSCIPNNVEVPPGGTKEGCCSGKITDRFGKKWCAADKCTPQGQTIGQKGPGHFCCARDTTHIEYDVNKPCGCVWGGKAPAGKLASRCCSQSLEKDGTCSWIDAPGTIEIWFNETECFSGDADDNNRCKCMPPLSTVRHKDAIKEHTDQCCSNRVISTGKNAGLCSCIRTGDRLKYGATESHCCSGKAKNGVCVCAESGSAYRKDVGMASQDCCSSQAGEHFCRCSPTGSSATSACCGDVSDKDKCDCIPDGHQVPSSDIENAAAVCCNAPKDACPEKCGK